MEGHGREYSPLERSRLLAPGLDSHGTGGGGSGGGGGDSSSAGGGGGAGSGLTSVSEFSSRTATPTPLTSLAAQYSRYGLPPALPAHSYTLMSSFLTSAHSAEARKALLPEFQHYWGEGVQRYLMSGLYPPYSPLFPPTAESLSLLGAGAGAGAGPAPAHHTAHYQRLLEMQKAEAYLASMSAAASHHTALYLPPAALPQLVEPPLPLALPTAAATTSCSTSSSASPAHSSNQAPLSLVKQEPRDLSCAEKVAKQSERRAMGVKVDLDQHHARLVTSQSLPTSTGGSRGSSSSAMWSAPLKEPKLSPSAMAISPETSSRRERRQSSGAGGGGGRVTPGASSRNSSHSETTSNSINPASSTVGSSESASYREDASRHNTHGSSTRRSATPRPGAFSDKTSNSISSVATGGSSQNCNVSNRCISEGHVSRKSAKSSSKQQKTHSARVSPSSLSPSSAMDMSIPSVPTKLAPPIALATVQHDGILLSALASPSSAAASSAASKTFSVKQVVARGGSDDVSSNHNDKRVGNTPSSSTTRQVDLGMGTSSSSLTAPAHSSSSSSSKERTSASNRAGSATRNSSHDRSDSKVSSDENSSDIVVDSTESDDVMSTSDVTTPATANSQAHSQAQARLTAAAAIKSEQDRAIEETIQRVLANQDGCSDPVDTMDTMDNSSSAAGASRAGTSGLTPSTVSTTSTRTVYAKTQSVPTVTSAGSIPVGIAVAQIRPHHIHQSRDTSSVSGVSREQSVRHASPSGSNRPRPPPATHLTQGNHSHPAGLTQGQSVAGSTRLGQGSQSPASQSTRPRYPVSAPEGFKFTVDPSSGQVFLVHSEDVEDQSSQWPVSTLPVTSGATSGLRKSSTPLPTVTVHSPEPTQTPSSNLNLKDGKQDNLAHQTSLKSSEESDLRPEDSRRSVGSSLPVAPGQSSGFLWAPSQSRGCSPILCEEFSPLSLLSTLSSLSSRKPTTCSIGVQVGDNVGRGRKKRTSLPRHLSLDQGVQTSPLAASTTSPHYRSKVASPLPSSSSASSSSKALNPLTAHCQPLEVKVGEEGGEDAGPCLYNPFTDPQILQAAHGLELLSTLAEKRPKCSSSSAASSLDDPKHIYPSPSDSYDTLSPTLDPLAEPALGKNGHPRREVRRELSPKWTRPKKEPQDGVTAGDFKPPPDIELAHDLDVRVKLVEVQRQYKEKQRELAKLQSKKLDAGASKIWKRGPGRPPKKKTQLKKSDDDSSSSSSKPKDSHHPHQKKKRPAEELVDRIYRKLAPDKPNKVSRSIHYVKSKTGPFFRRKSASSSVKRNKDLFGIDPSMWPSYSERKHQEKVKHGKEKYKVSYASHLPSDLKSHFTFKSKSHKSTYPKDTGNIFANLQKTCIGGEFLESQASKAQLPKVENTQSRLDLSASSSAMSKGIIKTETSATSASSHSPDIGLLAKFSLTPTSPATANSASVSTSTGASPSAPGPSTVFSTPTPAPTCSISQTMGIFISTPGLTAGGLYSATTTVSTSSRTTATFGSISSFRADQGVGFFNTTNNVDKSKAMAGTSSSSHPPQPNGLTPTTVIAPTTTTMSTTLSTGAAATVAVTASSEPVASSSTAPPVVASPPNQLPRRRVSESSSQEQEEGCGSNTANESGLSKRKVEDDSDTDASETGPNKKRKPGRPRKINPEKSSGGTETIWSKKSSATPENNSNNQNDSKQSETDSSSRDEWGRRRSERIFLSEPGPSSSLVVLTSGFHMAAALPSAISPRSNSSEQITWKLSNFIPKSKKLLESKSSASPQPGIKTEKKDEPSPGPSQSGRPAKSQETPSKKSSSSNKVEAEFLSSPPSPVPQKSKRGRKPKDDKSKIKKMKKEREASSSSPSPPKLMKKECKSDELARMKQPKSNNLLDITQRVKKKFSKANKQAEENSKGKPFKDRKKGKDKQKGKDFDPEPRSCKLTREDLREGLKVLYHNDGLFYEGTIKALQPPDVYGVLTAGQRGNRPHILSLEEVLKDAVLDVRPGSKRYLPVGTRVCAFWSQQFSCLYPGTIARSSSSSSDSSSNTVSVDFDDEDSGRIPIEHIRFLPADFPIIEYEPDPLDNLPKKRRARAESDLSESEKPQKSRKNPSKPDSDDEEEESKESDLENGGDEKSGTDESDSTDSSTELLYWQWHGSPVRKPGHKGKIFVKGKRVFYNAITRNSEVINVGDAAIFVSTGRTDFPYIGNIENLWQTASGNMKVKVRWYYHPEETNSGRKLGDLKNGLFTSPHMDENDVQSIAHKCEVMTPAQYRKRGQSEGSHVYYCAGHYDPVSTVLTLNPGVS